MKLGDLPGETIVYVCDGVFTGQRPMTLFLFTDMEPQALCDEQHGDDESTCKPPHLVCLDHCYGMFRDGLPWLPQLELGDAAIMEDGEWVVEEW